MRKTLLLLLTLAMAAPAIAQQHTHHRKFLCTDRASGSTPLHLYNSTTDRWCAGATINDPGNDVDICIEGDTDTALVCTDAGNERVGISTATPQALLDVRGPTGTGAAAAGVAVLATDETTVVDADQLGCVNFQAPSEASGTDAILVSAGICAEADATFSASANNTEIVFKTATTAAAAEVARIDASGNVGVNTAIPSTLLEVQADAGAAGTATLSSAELTVVDGDELGCVNFQAPLESDGTDAVAIAAQICAEADATFDATTNTTDIVFKTGESEAATEKLRIAADGVLVLNGFTADPCSSGAPAGGIFYNSTSNYLCYCNGTDDVKANDNTTACF